MLQHVKTAFTDKYAHSNTISPETHLPTSCTICLTQADSQVFLHIFLSLILGIKPTKSPDFGDFWRPP